MTDFGLMVAELRALRGLTQEQLAELVDLSPRQIQRLEAGDANITVERLFAVAAVLDTPVVAFFGTPKSERARPGRPRKA